MRVHKIDARQFFGGRSHIAYPMHKSNPTLPTKVKATVVLTPMMLFSASHLLF